MIARSFFRLGYFLAAALFVSGCASRHRPPDRVGDHPTAARAATPVKQGEAVFFAGEVEARVDVVPAGHPSLSPREGRPLPESGGRPSGPPPGGGRGGESRTAGVGGPNGGHGGRSGEATMPPARISLTLTNRGATALDVEIAAFDSVLGNFAVRPERLRLEPGMATSPDPMTTRLGVSSDDIPLKITLVRAGLRETQTMVIRDLAPPTGAL